jgi:hypothetical protein
LTCLFWKAAAGLRCWCVASWIWRCFQTSVLTLCCCSQLLCATYHVFTHRSFLGVGLLQVTARVPLKSCSSRFPGSLQRTRLCTPLDPSSSSSCCPQLLMLLHTMGRSAVANANDPQGMLFRLIANAAHMMTHPAPKELQVGARGVYYIRISVIFTPLGVSTCCCLLCFFKLLMHTSVVGGSVAHAHARRCTLQ